MKKIAFFTLLCLSFSLALAINELPGNIGYFNPKFQLGSIFDTNKLQMSHSMSFSSGVSSNGFGFYESSYTNHLKFDLRENLKFNIDLSLVNIGSMTHDKLNFKSNNDNQNLVIPSFSLDYQPFENTSIRIEYRQLNNSPFNFSRNNDFRW